MGDHMNYVMTLANSIIGVGVLAMPFCFQKCGIALAILMILLSSVISRLSCHFLLKASIYARRKNFEFLAFHALGSTGKLLVELGIIGFLMGTVIAFFVVVGDLGPEIIAKILNIESSQSLRSWLLIFITIGCVLPLGLLRNVDSLTSICTVTIGFYVCLVIKVMLESTKHISNSDWMDKVEIWKPSGILQCLPIFSMALFCQTQIFEIYSSMENPSLEKMNLVIKYAINICAVVYILVGSFGYIAFCHQHFGGNILLSFSPTPMSDIIKMGFVLSVAFSFPLAIFPCRASLYSLLFRRVTSQHEVPMVMPERRFRCLTVLIVAVGLAVAMALPCIELVLGLVGSTMGVAVCVLLPAACYVKVVTRQNNERLLAQIVLVIGILIMVFGTYANLYAMDEATSSMNIEKVVENPELLDNDFPKFHEVNDKILMAPLEDTKLKLSNVIQDDKVDVLSPENKDRNQKDIKEEVIEKVKDVHKDVLIESPPLPVEKEELVEVVDIVKVNEPSREIKKENNVDVQLKSKIHKLPKVQDNIKVLKNKLPLEYKLIKNMQEPNLVEISKDAINKEDDELGLEKNSASLKDNAQVKGFLQNAVVKGELSQNIPNQLDKSNNNVYSKVESVTEGRVIQDIKKEKLKLDNEFQRKVVENVNLIASMNKKRIPNLKTKDINTVDDINHTENKGKKLKIEQEISKEANEFVKNYIKPDNIHKVDVVKPKRKEKELFKSEEINVNVTVRPGSESHIKKPNNELDMINAKKSERMLDDSTNKPKNNLTSKDPVMPIVLLRNYTKSISNVDNKEKEQKFIQREILEIATEKTTKKNEEIKQRGEHFERLKRDTEREIRLNSMDENCIKPEQIVINMENEPKILSNNNFLTNPSVNVENHAFSDVLKPSSRDLKFIPSEINKNSH